MMIFRTGIGSLFLADQTPSGIINSIPLFFRDLNINKIPWLRWRTLFVAAGYHVKSIGVVGELRFLTDGAGCLLSAFWAGK